MRSRTLLISSLLCAFANVALATDISVVGLFTNKAVLAVGGGPPKTYTVGNTVSTGIKLLAVDASSATFDINGKRQTIAIGEYINHSGPSGIITTTLQADGQGHFVVQGQINGGAVRMLLDTGATTVALPATDAVRLGIDYRNGAKGQVSTANGVVQAYRVKLNTIKVGDIELNQVDATVIEGGLPFILLGMSFLNRTEMRREGEKMILTKRF